jgi:hypothetical protein
MKRLFLLFFTTFCIECFAQISFEQGYIIFDSGETVECLIKNLDWKNNPTEFEYKLSQDSNPQNASMATVREFGITGASRYVRRIVKIDRASKQLNQMSSTRAPVFEEEQLFLKVLVEGNADLFMYEHGELLRFFYNVDTSRIQQLVYKQYRTSDRAIHENNQYRQELLNSLKCQEITSKDTENVKYKRKDLINMFIKYNECIDSEYVNYSAGSNSSSFNLKVKPGFIIATLTVDDLLSERRDIEFKNEIGLRFGVELEIVLPFNHNKWALILEPTYQHYKQESEKKYQNTNIKVNYNSIELAVGLRYYSILSTRSKLFYNLMVVLDLPFSSSMYTNLPLQTSSTLGFGIGYNYKNKYSVEFRYQTSRDIFIGYRNIRSSFRGLSANFGYVIL